MASNSDPRKPTRKRITIEMPKDLEAAYSNGTLITHTMAEMVLDFVQILPRVPKGKVVSRVIMSPMHAKRLQQVLTQTIANYERQFGEIRLPPSLVDQLFRFPPGGNEGDDEEDDKG